MSKLRPTPYKFAVTLEQIFSDQIFSRTPEQVQEFTKQAQNARLAMLKHIRPDVWTSQAYKDFLKGYPDESQIASDSDADVRDAHVKGPIYIVRREGLAFMMVESGGVMKIAGVAPAWMD